MTEALQFEMERRVIIFHRDTTMPDDTQLGYVGDPNDCVNGNTPGETLLYNSPSGTQYLDKSSSPYDLWKKVQDIAGGSWTLEGAGGISGDQVEVETFTLDATDIANEYVALTYQPEPSSIILTIQHAPTQMINVDYRQDATFLKRITWESLPLATLLEIGDSMTILYKRI